MKYALTLPKARFSSGVYVITGQTVFADHANYIYVLLLPDWTSSYWQENGYFFYFAIMSHRSQACHEINLRWRPNELFLRSPIVYEMF